MRQLIFSRKQFSLCTVPVPNGYPQSQTHSGVAVFDNRVILTTSPYPSIKFVKHKAYINEALRRLTFGYFPKLIIGEAFENPCIYIGEDITEIPTKFSLMQTRPLMEQPDAYYGLPAFNSDPDIFIENEAVYVLNRAIFRTKLCPGETLNKYVIRLYLIQGIIEVGRFKFTKIELFKETDNLFVSPCLFKYNDKYNLTYLDTACYIDGKSFNGLYIQKCSSIETLKSSQEWTKINIDLEGFIPWHMSVFTYGNNAYSIIACVKEGIGHKCWQLLGEFSNDLGRLKVYKTPLTDYDSYRSAAYVNSVGEFVLYNTTVHEKIKGGKSIDGREVIMAHMPFDKLLNQLRKNEQ